MSSTKMFGANSADMSKKIRAAIKAKLEELGVYVDEELPDYIMVMIANRKEKAQMKEDLLLFLGKNTNKFVDWLFEIFDRLQSAGAALPSEPIKKEPAGGLKKEKVKDEEPEKKHSKKERENESRKTGVKDSEKHKEKEKEHEHEKEKEERKEKEKREAKVTRSKIPSYHRASPSSPSREKPRTRIRSEAKPEVKDKGGLDSIVPSGSYSEKNGDKLLNKEAKSRPTQRKTLDTVEKKKHVEEVNPPRKRIEERISRRSPPHAVYRNSGRTRVDDDDDSARMRRKKDLTVLRPLDSDEEERIAEEETRQELSNKKVLSSAVLRVKQPEPTKTVSSKVIVKRKIPEKENGKGARGAQSLFLKAIKEAGRMTTRTASHMAGYGGGGPPAKKSTEKVLETITAEEDEPCEHQEEGIEIDDDIDMEEALVVMSSSDSSGKQRRRVAEGDFAKPEEDTEKPLTSVQAGMKEKLARGKSPKFFVTLKNTTGISHSMEELSVTESRKRHSGNTAGLEENEEVSGYSVDLRSKKQRKTDVVVRGEGDDEDSARPEKLVVAGESQSESRRNSAWDRQIPIEEEDSSEDDEAQIDAVLASAHTITVGFDDDEIPPTPTLTTPAFSVTDVNYHAPGDLSDSQDRSVAHVESSSVVGAGDKIMERCKFWPNCRLDEACIYMHPNKPCSNFPSCKFGDRCCYLHPPCKFDQHCTNSHCPFAHSPKTSNTAAVVHAAVTTPPAAAAPGGVSVSASLNASIACKFGSKCTNPNCSFKHPKMCRFGDRCTNRNCFFRHVGTLPTTSTKPASLDKYKWKATVPA